MIFRNSGFCKAIYCNYLIFTGIEVAGETTDMCEGKYQD